MTESLDSSPRWGFRRDIGDHRPKLVGNLNMLERVSRDDIDIFETSVVDAFNEVHALAVYAEIQV